MLSLETRSLWPPVIDHISVEKGYEKALGAALGDDLDAPVDPSSPMHWTEVTPEGSDPALPDGVEALAQHVKAPAQLKRRLSQIGVAERSACIRLAGGLKTGQRLVSREGDLWRWDGFVAAAHAPTGAARRLAQRMRRSTANSRSRATRSTPLAERSKRHNRPSMLRAVPKPKRARGSAASIATRRDLSALAEARARLNMSRDEAATAKTDAEKALNALAPSADLEAKLAQVRGDIAGKRSRLAEVQAEQQAIVREAELADRRLATLATDKKDWIERQQGARNQIATLEQRTIEAKRDRTELENAPKCSAKSGMR